MVIMLPGDCFGGVTDCATLCRDQVTTEPGCFIMEVPGRFWPPAYQTVTKRAGRAGIILPARTFTLVG